MRPTMGAFTAVMIAGATALSAACGKSGGAQGDGSFLEVRWTLTGADTAKTDSVKVSGPATAEWCDSLRLVQIQSLRGDTGIALALYPIKEFVAGRFPVVPPARADSVPPAAAVAIRWFAETSIRGFQGDSGEVVVRQERPGSYAGTFESAAHSVTDAAHLKMRGSFRGLTLRPAGRHCVAKPQRPDSGRGVH